MRPILRLCGAPPLALVALVLGLNPANPKMARSSPDLAVARRFGRVVTGEAVALIGVLVATALLMGAAS